MSNLRIAFIVTFIMSPLYLNAAKAAPDDLSVAAYEEFMANIDVTPLVSVVKFN